MAEQMQPMPDVPERCPMCGAPKRRQLLVGNYLTSNAIEFECETMVIEGRSTLESPNCLRRQCDAARTEAERLRQRHEALRAEVESVAQELRKRAYSCAKDWLETGHRYHDGASDAYYMAEEMVSRLLSEAGGDA